MKQKILLFVFFLLLFTPLVLISKNKITLLNKKTEEIPNTDVETQIITKPIPLPYEKILLSRMTNEQKVGQIFIWGVEGTSNLTPENKKFIQTHKPGGVLLMQRNISDENQLRLLIQDIQSTNSIPLFISIDQEGGVVSRLKWNEILVYPQKSIKTPQNAFEISKQRGLLLKGYGINMNLAPVIEYSDSSKSFIYKRTFSGDINEVIEKSIASLNGYRESGIIPVAKHYPGHGNSVIDPHYNLPIIDIVNDKWEEHSKVFNIVIRDTNLDALMVGHILFPKIDSSPATISNIIIQERLKSSENFTGLILSDDMEMNALDGLRSPTELAEAALRAGCDILIYSKYSLDNRYHQQVVYEHILNLVNKNLINIDEKVLKILQLKIKYGIINRE
ncbi:glycoside hydrolase family 3 protein [Candidatus Dojkabacteria bacterium]|uniref:beta-N-acetylhexosaminidase n=1 Tax=Candidatus Dojkabacteria bacterium TaxID=2099670 RepID=A0A847CZV5_9BACT|nr:glycoside hydrolase family 3 protein [Candidatus Dojkabacteria bacterium]